MPTAIVLVLVTVLTQSAPTGRIAGIVTDPTGGVMPGVTITLADAAGQSRTAVTDSRGRYEIGGLIPGVYHAQAQLAGFVTRRREAIKVADQATTEWQVSLGLLMSEIQAPSSATVHDPTPSELTRSVYAAALGAIRDLSSPVTIRPVSLVIPADFQEDFWEGVLQRVPSELRKVVASSAIEPVLLNAASLPEFAKPAGSEAKAETRSTASLSRAFVTPSGLDALVLYSHWCGNLCGSGGAIWLHRDSIATAWRVEGLREFWES